MRKTATKTKTATAAKSATKSTARRKLKPSQPVKSDGVSRTDQLIAMLKGKGSTVPAICKALGWLPHTLRARLSRLQAPKKDGGDGLKLERERADGVTTYRLA